MFKEVFMSDPFEVSLLHALHLVHALKSLEWISGAMGGAGQDDFDWAAEPWSHCDMFTHYAPGVRTGFGQALRKSCGRIHWAGTETVGVWSGSIEAANRSGERAADEVLKR
jgi:monoamine oxidase